MPYGKKNWAKMPERNSASRPEGPVATTGDSRHPSKGSISESVYKNGVQTVNMGSIKVVNKCPIEKA